VARDGMVLELWDRPSNELALWAFFSDADGSFEVTRYRADVPPEVEAWFQAEARRRSPPVANAEDLKVIAVPMLVIHDDDDQIVPIAASALRSAKLLKKGTLKVYEKFPHGMCTTHAERGQCRPSRLHQELNWQAARTGSAGLGPGPSSRSHPPVAAFVPKLQLETHNEDRRDWRHRPHRNQGGEEADRAGS